LEGHLLPRYNGNSHQLTMIVFLSGLPSQSSEITSQLSNAPFKVNIPYTSPPNVPIVVICYPKHGLLNTLLTGI